MADQDVFKMLKDLELKAVGLDEQTKQMQEGYFISFRNVGLPLPEEDFSNPFTPSGAELAKYDDKVAHTDPVTPPVQPNPVSAATRDDADKLAHVAQSIQVYVNTFGLTDRKLNMSSDWSVMPNSTNLSDTWANLVAGATIGVTSVIPPELKAKIDAATAVLQDANGDPTPRYMQYQNYRSLYEKAVRTRNKAYADAFSDANKLAQWPTNGIPYQDDVDSAFNDWEGEGHKAEIETAIDTLASVGENPATAAIARAKARFENARVTIPGIGNLPYVSLEPPSFIDASMDDGWTEYTSVDLSSSENYHASSTAFGGNVGVQVGLWSASGGLESTNSQTKLDVDTNDIQVTFSYCVVDIIRWGFDTTLLNLSNWYLMGDYPKGVVSTGKMGQERPTQASGLEPEFLPSIVTSLVLIRDVSLTWSHWSDHQNWLDNAISGHGSVGYGPFAIGGNYSHHNSDHSLSYELTGETLKIGGVCLMGYVSAITPYAPNMEMPKTPASVNALSARRLSDLAFPKNLGSIASPRFLP